MKKLYNILLIAMLAIGLSPVSARNAMADASSYTLLDEEPTDGEDGDDEEDPDEPYVEPAFTITIDLDNPDAVSAEIRNCYGNFVSTVALTAGDNELTVDPGDNYLMFYVNDGYAFEVFDDDEESSSYLQYIHQTSPVTVRKAISLGSEESIVVDGHHFTVRTYNLSALKTYTLTVNVDEAAKVEMRIGTGSNIESGSNRTVTLVDGENTVEYNSDDLFLHFRSATFMDKIQSATFNGSAVATDGSFWPVYSVPLKGSKTEGGILDIVAKLPELVDQYTFTVLVDDIDCVRYFTRKPADRDLRLQEGTNTVGFSDGDSFEVWCTKEAYSCTFNGEAVEFNDYITAYIFTPTADGVLDLRFNEPAAEFTFKVDDASMVAYLMNNETEEEFELVDGVNIIPIANPGDSFCVGTVRNVAAFSFTIDGVDVPRVKRLYEFTPETGSQVVVYFTEPVTLVGDANGDGTVTVADVVSVCNYVLGIVPSDFDVDAADVNNDGDITVSDVVLVVNLILSAG